MKFLNNNMKCRFYLIDQSSLNGNNCNLLAKISLEIIYKKILDFKLLKIIFKLFIKKKDLIDLNLINDLWMSHLNEKSCHDV